MTARRLLCQSYASALRASRQLDTMLAWLQKVRAAALLLAAQQRWPRCQRDARKLVAALPSHISLTLAITTPDDIAL